ncbi:MAG: DNA methyltransferase [Vampirovibrionia bacterium]
MSYTERFYQNIAVIYKCLSLFLQNQQLQSVSANESAIVTINTIITSFLLAKRAGKKTFISIYSLPQKIMLPDFLRCIYSETNIHSNELYSQIFAFNPSELNTISFETNSLIKLIETFEEVDFNFTFSLNDFGQNTLNASSLCYLYESLINSSEQIISNDVYYTEIEELKAMSILVLSSYIKDNLGDDYLSLVKEVLSTDIDLCHKGISVDTLIDVVSNIRIIDPACGCGALLLEMLSLLFRIILKFNRDNAYNILTKVITNNIFGIELRSWACSVVVSNLFLIYLYNSLDLTDINAVIGKFKFNISNDDALTKDWSELFIAVDKEFFDIIIANPPYIRHEKISNLSNKDDNRNISNSLTYKELLIDRINTICNQKLANIKPKTTIKLDAKSDIYIYFFFVSLFNLKSKGTLCFITSNSWLDVDFGMPLQDFILKTAQLRLLIDSNTRRSFQSADINTVITLISNINSTNNTSGFLTIKNTIPESDYIEYIQRLDNSENYLNTESYNLYSVKQSQILDNNKIFKKNIWGSVYLRAPDIYRIIKNKAQQKLLPLSSCCKIKFGIKSGVNSFFYLSDDDVKRWNVEPQFIKKFLYSFKEVKKYVVEEKLLVKNLLVCNLTYDQLEDAGYKNVLRYIKWGEAQEYHLRPSVSSRQFWYMLQLQDNIDFVSNRFIGERFGFPIVGDIPVCDVFFTGKFTDINAELGNALINSTLSYLFTEVIARKTYGIGVAYLYGPELNHIEIVNNCLIDSETEDQIIDIFNRIKQREIYKLKDELNQSDRRELDFIIFKLLGLSRYEQDAVYDELLKMVENRHIKAHNFNS